MTLIIAAVLAGMVSGDAGATETTAGKPVITCKASNAPMYLPAGRELVQFNLTAEVELNTDVVFMNEEPFNRLRSLNVGVKGNNYTTVVSQGDELTLSRAELTNRAEPVEATLFDEFQVQSANQLCTFVIQLPKAMLRQVNIYGLVTQDCGKPKSESALLNCSIVYVK